MGGRIVIFFHNELLHNGYESVVICTHDYLVSFHKFDILNTNSVHLCCSGLIWLENATYVIRPLKTRLTGNRVCHIALGHAGPS